MGPRGEGHRDLDELAAELAEAQVVRPVLDQPEYRGVETVEPPLPQTISYPWTRRSWAMPLRISATTSSPAFGGAVPCSRPFGQRSEVPWTDLGRAAAEATVGQEQLSRDGDVRHGGFDEVTTNVSGSGHDAIRAESSERVRYSPSMTLDRISRRVGAIAPSATSPSPTRPVCGRQESDGFGAGERILRLHRRCGMRLQDPTMRKYSAVGGRTQEAVAAKTMRDSGPSCEASQV